MVLCQLSRLQVDHVDLLPVAAAAGDGVGGILAVVREVDALQGHRTVGAQFVGVEEHAGLTAQLVHYVHHALVLQAVVLVEVPLAVTLPWRRDLLVVGQFCQPLQQLPSEGNLLQVGVGHLVLCLHPCCCLSACVVLQPAVGIGHLRAEILVNSAVLRGLGVLQSLC